MKAHDRCMLELFEKDSTISFREPPEQSALY
jgi:hypothetical protein